MKVIFIVNPEAGKGKGIDRLKEEIKLVSERTGIPAGFYLTKSVGDAEKFARTAAAELREKGEALRLIACGGDGTVNEVINGVIGYENVAVGIMPIGTGNDFVRNFPDAGDFMSIEAQLKAETTKADVIKYEGSLAGKMQTRYCINMFNIGFDCNVVDLTGTLKKYPFLKGSMAYLAAVVGILIKKKGACLKVEADGELVHEGKVLLTAVANGSYCGGGVKSSPRASLKDGLMDLNIIYNVSRREFVSKFPSYAKGTHLGLEDIDRLLLFKQCRKVVITPLEESMRLCTDGEITDAGKVIMEAVPQAIDIMIPQIL